MFAAAICALAEAAAAEPACSTRVLLEPDSAYVGQQVVYRLQVLRRPDVVRARFADELSFPSFRVEWLHGQSPDPVITGIGGHALVAEERRALFPTRAGTLAIPPARIECEAGDGRFEIDVPGAALAVREPPPDGRPPDADVLVGRVALGARVAAERIALGESVAFTVTMRGEANLWDAAPPLAGDALAGVDVHAREPVLERQLGRRLELRRIFAYDLVPRAAGAFVIPALRVPWLDPAAGRYEVAETQALRVEVAPAPPAATPPAAATRPQRAKDWGGLSRLIGIALGCAAAVFAGEQIARRLSRGRAARRAAAPHLAAARDAAARGDATAQADALALALRAALAARVPASRAAAPEEIAAHGGAAERAVAEALADLDRARFARASAPVPDVARIDDLIRAL